MSCGSHVSQLECEYCGSPGSPIACDTCARVSCYCEYCGHSCEKCETCIFCFCSKESTEFACERCAIKKTRSYGVANDADCVLCASCDDDADDCECTDDDRQRYLRAEECEWYASSTLRQWARGLVLSTDFDEATTAIETPEARELLRFFHHYQGLTSFIGSVVLSFVQDEERD